MLKIDNANKAAVVERVIIREVERAYSGYIKRKVGKYSAADLILEKGDSRVFVEVKARNGKYTLEYMNEKGMMSPHRKLESLNKEFGTTSYNLVTVTSDGFILTATVDENTRCEILPVPKSTYGNKSGEREMEKYSIIEKFQVSKKKIEDLLSDEDLKEFNKLYGKDLFGSLFG